MKLVLFMGHSVVPAVAWPVYSKRKLFPGLPKVTFPNHAITSLS